MRINCAFVRAESPTKRERRDRDAAGGHPHADV